MYQFRADRLFAFLGLKFWLPLPLLGLLFWIAGKTAMTCIIESTRDGEYKIKANMQREVKPSKKVLSIQVKIDKNKGISLVEVITADKDIKQLEYKFYLTHPRKIEAAIAKELGLSPTQVRGLVRYKYQIHKISQNRF